MNRSMTEPAIPQPKRNPDRTRRRPIAGVGDVPAGSRSGDGLGGVGIGWTLRRWIVVLTAG